LYISPPKLILRLLQEDEKQRQQQSFANIYRHIRNVAPPSPLVRRPSARRTPYMIAALKNKSTCTEGKPQITIWEFFLQKGFNECDVRSFKTQNC
jgi:hypothetical protein